MRAAFRDARLGPFVNLFTNPRLKGDGTYAELRRNLHPAPRANSLGAFAVNRFQGGVYALPEGGIQFAAAGTNGIRLGVVTRTMAQLPWVAEGASVRIMLEMKAPTPITGVSLRARNGTPSPEFTVPTEWTWFDETVVAGDSLDPEYTGMLLTGDYSNGAVIEVRRVLIAEGGDSGPWFDGSTTPETAEGIDQPEDFRWRWLGNPNQSESVMEIERVRGVTGTNAVAGASTWEGKPAVRIINNHSTSVGSFLLDLSHLDLSSGTAAGTIHYPYDRTAPGTLRNRIRARFTYLNDVLSDSAPNEAGSYPLRLTWSENRAATQVSWFNGGRQGFGDVWWTDIGLFEGHYTGPSFDGDSHGCYWLGVPHQSPSQGYPPLG